MTTSADTRPSCPAPEQSSPPLPTVAALDRLWAEVACRPLYAPPNFWRYLRLRWQMRLTMLSPERVAKAAPYGKANDCSACTDMCCIGPRSTVLCRLRDIATLVDLGRTDLLKLDKPQFSAADLAARPALGRQVASRAWQTFPVLAQNSYGACRALTPEGKCSLYPHWPMSCARFPYALNVDDLEVFYSSRCQSFWIHPAQEPRARFMAVQAVASYNERIKDAVLLAYAPHRLRELGLLQYLSLPSPGRPTAHIGSRA